VNNALYKPIHIPLIPIDGMHGYMDHPTSAISCKHVEKMKDDMDQLANSIGKILGTFQSSKRIVVLCTDRAVITTILETVSQICWELK
jgi:hypothetical protein